MSGVDLQADLVGAQFSGQASDLAAAKGGALVTGNLAAEFARGIDVGIEIKALASLDAEFRKFLLAELDVLLQAKAEARAQVQLPLNLFDEVGLAVRLRLMAQVSAAVQLGLGLSVGDFLDLVDSQPSMAGLPSRLFRVFLEEVNFSGGVYAAAAASAQAYANMIIAGKLVAEQGDTEEPGFNIVVGAGAGFKAGFGFRVFVNAGFKDVRTFVRRSVDVLVDELIADLARRIPGEDPVIVETLDALRPMAKMAFRNAYELGEFMTKHPVMADSEGAQKTALRSFQVFLEESRRYMLEKLLHFAIDSFGGALQDQGIDRAAWDAASDEREALASLLANRPATDPFDLADYATRTYWIQVLTTSMTLGSALAGIDSAKWRQQAATLYAALELSAATVRILSTAEASAQVFGVSPVGTRTSFDGDLAIQPPSEIAAAIKAALASPPTTLKHIHLAEYLATTAVLDPVLDRFPGLRRYVDLFQGTLGGASVEIAASLLTQGGAFLSGTASPPDPLEALDRIGSDLKAFLKDQLKDEVLPLVRERIGDRPDLKLYLDDVCLPSLSFTIDTIYVQLRNWADGTVNERAFKEALSAILMSFVGRSLVVTTDVVATHAQERLAEMLREAADHVDDPGGLAEHLAGPFGEDAGEIIQEILEIGAEVFGPYPPATRQRIRNLLFEMIEPLPLDRPADLVNVLADDLSLPNPESARALTEELVGIAWGHFLSFSEKVLARIAEKVLDELQELLEDLETAVRESIAQLERDFQEAVRLINELLGEIAGLLQELDEQLDAAAEQFRILLDSLTDSEARSDMKDRVVDHLHGLAIGPLEEQDIYKALPGSVRSATRQTLRDSIRIAVDAAILDPALVALGEIANDFDDLFEDIREIDGGGNVATQILNIVLNKVEDRVVAEFGNRLGLDIRFSINISVDVPFLGRQTFRETFDLGYIGFPTSELIGMIRNVIEGTAFIENEVNELAELFGAAWTTEIALADAEAERGAYDENRQAIERELAEADGSAAEITLLSPSAAASYSGDVEVEIQLAHVPFSFLGLGANQAARVFVFLNGESRQMREFEVSERPARHSAPGLRGAGRGMDLGSGIISGTKPGLGAGATPAGASGPSASRGEVARFMPGAVVTGWGGVLGMPLVAHKQARTTSQGVARTRGGPPRVPPKATKVHAKSRDTSSEQSIGRGGAPLPRGILGTPAIPSGVASRTILSGTGNIGRRKRAGAAMRTDFGQDAPLGGPFTGRKLTLTQRDELRESSAPGLTLRRTYPIELLEEGINTLVVVVMDGRGNRVERSATFTVSEPRAVKPQEPARRPGETGPVIRQPVAAGTSASWPVKPRRGASPKQVKGKVFISPRAARAATLARSRTRLRVQLAPLRTTVTPRAPRATRRDGGSGAGGLTRGDVVQGHVVRIVRRGGWISVAPAIEVFCPAAWFLSDRERGDTAPAVGTALTVQVSTLSRRRAWVREVVTPDGITEKGAKP